MSATTIENIAANSTHATVASYPSHTQAEHAVQLLSAGGIPADNMSIIGRNYETREDVIGYYRPGDAAMAGAGEGAWFGGFVGLMLGAFGFFIFPMVGTLLVLGPLSGMIAGAIGGAGVGALVSGLVAAGIPKDEALKYQSRIQAGEYLVVIHGGPTEAQNAHRILESTDQTHLQAYGV